MMNLPIALGWCDHEAAYNGGRSDCPSIPFPPAAHGDLMSGIWDALMHPGLDTWTQRAALGCWLAVGLTVIKYRGVFSGWTGRMQRN